MSTFEVPILTVDDVYDHPNADRLSILRIRGYEAITNKHEDGSHRYGKGEPVIYVPEGAVIPEAHLKARGYWNDTKDVGMLAGSKGDRVKALALRGVLSQGLVWKIDDHNPEDGSPVVVRDGERWRFVELGEDVAAFFGIEKYVPQVPIDMEGRMIGLYESAFDYDIENIKAFPELFEAGEEVVVTEKIHGTLARITYLPALEPRGDLFGDGRVTISTKGMGSQGLTFINIPENAQNLYVRFLADKAVALQKFGDTYYPGAKVHLMGEVFGPGVQDFNYGLPDKNFRAFDVAITDADGTSFLDDEAKHDAFEALGLDRVPVLYEGPFDRDLINELSDGGTTIEAAGGAPHIREGVVITARGSQTKRDCDLGRRTRPILKHVSTAYLTRRDGTEYQ